MAEQQEHRVILRVGGDRFALPRGAVRGILESPRLTPLAGLGPRLAGVLQYRERWIPALWLGRVLAELSGAPSSGGEGEAGGAAVVRRGGIVFALVADSVVVEEGEGEGTFAGPKVIPLELESLFHAPLPPALREPALVETDGAGKATLAALTLRAGELELAVPSGAVREVLKADALERLPGAPAGVVGRVEVRGGHAPVVDLALALGLPIHPDDEDTRIVAAAAGEDLLGLRVAAVGQTVAAPGDAVVATPAFLAAYAGEWLEAIIHLDDHRLLLLLRPDRLLAPEALAKAVRAAEGG